MGTKLYQVSDVGFRYESDWILRGISFQIEEGEFLGLIGPNGSGKTTLLKLLSRLLSPVEGTITFKERPLDSWNHRELAREVGVVPQEISIVYPLTVLEIVLMGRSPYASLLGFDKTGDIRIAEEMLERVGLSRISGRPVSSISGGEQQMVFIARALAQQAGLLLLDEPTAYLDIAHQVSIHGLLKRLNTESGLTVITVSHDLNLASQYCSRLILLSKGEVYAQGRPDDVITADNIKDVYGCHPLVDRHPVTGTPRITLVPEERIT